MAQAAAAADNPLQAQVVQPVRARAAATVRTSQWQERELSISQREQSLERTLRSSTSEKVTFNVGGEKFELASATLAALRATWFEGVLSPDFRRCDDGSVFVDRDPGSFRIILDFIRYGVLPELKDDPILAHKLAADATFYSYGALQNALYARKRRKMMAPSGLSCSSSATTARTADNEKVYWDWIVLERPGSPGSNFSVTGGVIKALCAGVYELVVRVSESQTGINVIAKLLLNDEVIDKAESNSATGYPMMYFSKVLELHEGAEIKLEACINGSNSLRRTCASLHLMPVEQQVVTEPSAFELKRVVTEGDDPAKYVRLEGKGCDKPNQEYLWELAPQGSQSASPNLLSLLPFQTGVAINVAGRYLVMVCVDEGPVDLRKGDVSIAVAWSGCLKGIFSLEAGDSLKTYNIDLSRSGRQYQHAQATSTGRTRASYFTLMRLGD
eukprot:jgi/Mesvir1/8650/Mv02594-RA.1